MPASSWPPIWSSSVCPNATSVVAVPSKTWKRIADGTNAKVLEYDTSEFGRIRLQYTHDQSDVKTNDELLLQYTVIFGPHGAHRY